MVVIRATKLLYILTSCSERDIHINHRQRVVSGASKMKTDIWMGWLERVGTRDLAGRKLIQSPASGPAAAAVQKKILLFTLTYVQ